MVEIAIRDWGHSVHITFAAVYARTNNVLLNNTLLCDIIPQILCFNIIWWSFSYFFNGMVVFFGFPVISCIKIFNLYSLYMLMSISDISRSKVETHKHKIAKKNSINCWEVRNKQWLEVKGDLRLNVMVRIAICRFEDWHKNKIRTKEDQHSSAPKWVSTSCGYVHATILVRLTSLIR